MAFNADNRDSAGPNKEHPPTTDDSMKYETGSDPEDLFPKCKVGSDPEDLAFQIYRSRLGGAYGTKQLFRSRPFQKRLLAGLESGGAVMCSFLEYGKIWSDLCEDPLKEGSLRRWLTEATAVDYRSKGYDFQLVRDHFLSRLFATKREDPRIFVQWGSFFLVKKLFTFGLSVVMPGCYHYVRTFHKHLDLYELESSPKEDRRSVYEERDLPHDDRRFKMTIIPPFDYFFIPSGKEYVLVAPSKCLFYLTMSDEEK